MPKQTLEFTCLLISPSDVDQERDAVLRTIQTWNASAGRSLNTRIEVRRWEDAHPEMGGHPQEVLNKQIVDGCDFGIAVFWSRLGSPTKNHPSGSVEEIERLVEQKANVMVYFCARPIPQSNLKDDQFNRLQEVKKDFRDRGLQSEFHSVDELEKKLLANLMSQMGQLVSQHQSPGEPVPSAGTLTAPTPDVRVTVNNVVTHHPSVGVRTFIQLKAMNFSPVPVFISSAALSGPERQLVFSRDEVTGENLYKKRLEPGESFSVHMDPSSHGELVRTLTVGRFTDDLGRRFQSPEGQLQEAMGEWDKWQETLNEDREEGSG